MFEPIVFSLQKVVTKDHTDELQHVNNVVFISFLQEAAIAHWYSAVPKEISDPIRWVVRKHEVEYLKQANDGDILTIKTWVQNFEGVTSDRHYQIFINDILIVKARTLWVAIDPVTMRPKRIETDSILKYFYKSK